MSEMAYLKVQNERECVLRVECWWDAGVSGGMGFVTYANFSQLELV